MAARLSVALRVPNISAMNSCVRFSSFPSTRSKHISNQRESGSSAVWLALQGPKFSVAATFEKATNTYVFAGMVIHIPKYDQLFLHCEIPRNCWKKLSISAEGDWKKLRRLSRKADPSEQPLWYLSMLRVYAKLSLETAPELFSQAVAAINRVPSEQNAIRSVQPPDVRAALRLQLLAAILEQGLTSKKTIPVRRTP